MLDKQTDIIKLEDMFSEGFCYIKASKVSAINPMMYFKDGETTQSVGSCISLDSACVTVKKSPVEVAELIGWV